MPAEAIRQRQDDSPPKWQTAADAGRRSKPSNEAAEADPANHPAERAQTPGALPLWTNGEVGVKRPGSAPVR